MIIEKIIAEEGRKNIMQDVNIFVKQLHHLAENSQDSITRHSARVCLNILARAYPTIPPEMTLADFNTLQKYQGRQMWLTVAQRESLSSMLSCDLLLIFSYYICHFYGFIVWWIKIWISTWKQSPNFWSNEGRCWGCSFDVYLPGNGICSLALEGQTAWKRIWCRYNCWSLDCRCRGLVVVQALPIYRSTMPFCFSVKAKLEPYSQ